MHNTTTYFPIDFYENFLRVKSLEKPNEKTKGYRLRHEAFVEELHWVPAQANGLEIDQYDDERMVPIGIFDTSENLIAYLRITLPNHPFMMEYEKMASINEPIEKSTTTIEISRVCTALAIRKSLLETPYGTYNVSMLLYKGLYQWCQINQINDMYMVVENKLYRLLKLSGFPCKPVGDITVMPDGAKTVAIRVDWQRFDSQNQIKRPDLYHWFNTIETTDQAQEIGHKISPRYMATATA